MYTCVNIYRYTMRGFLRVSLSLGSLVTDALVHVPACARAHIHTPANMNHTWILYKFQSCLLGLGSWRFILRTFWHLSTLWLH